MDLARMIAVARGDEPADLVLKNARVVHLSTGEIATGDVAVVDGMIGGIEGGYRGLEETDLEGRYLAPGFIDAHVHVESSLVPPGEFARAVVPRGVTTAITNPHEIANVLGSAGIRFMLRDALGTPLDALVTVPSCVPATALATSGAEMTPAEIAPLRREPGVVGLGEVMDFAGVIAGELRVLEEIRAFQGSVVDGHAPGLGGRQLAAYVAAGIGSDHECTDAAEAWEKLRLGMTIFIREGTAARNLEALLPLVTPETERRLCFCTDDRQPSDLLAEGSVDHLVRVAINRGISPVTALRMVSLNPAEHYRLFDRGLIAPGRRADLVAFGDLRAPSPDRVYKGGRLVARDGHLLKPRRGETAESGVRNTVRVDWGKVDFRISPIGSRIRVIGVQAGQLRTDSLVEDARLREGEVVADTERDLLKMAVIERHGGSGGMGLGFVRGMGLKRGAMAGTVAHDHHNLVVIGADDLSMMVAARAVARSGGGLAVAEGESVRALLPLPIAGLMSDEPIEEVRGRLEELIRAARELGSQLHDPFMTMSFLGLEVIPELKLTDLGLVSVRESRVVPLFV